MRDEGILVVGTGNVVHNLDGFRGGGPLGPPGWAERCESRIRAAVVANDVQAVIDAPSKAPDAALAVPDIDHYLPLLYVLAVRRADDAVSFPTEGIEYDAISMLSVRLG